MEVYTTGIRCSALSIIQVEIHICINVWHSVIAMDVLSLWSPRMYWLNDYTLYMYGFSNALNCKGFYMYYIYTYFSNSCTLLMFFIFEKSWHDLFSDVSILVIL